MGADSVTVGANHVTFCGFLDGLLPRGGAATVTDVEAFLLRISVVKVEHEGRISYPTVVALATEPVYKLLFSPTPVP